MYILLTLFFISLAGVIIMIGRKLMLVRNGHITLTKEVLDPRPVIPDVKKIKHLAIQVLKNLIYISTFLALKIYVKTSNFIKTQYVKIRTKMAGLQNKNQDGEIIQAQNTNRFLKVIADYKQKISRMKHQIDEREKNK